MKHILCGGLRQSAIAMTDRQSNVKKSNRIIFDRILKLIYLFVWYVCSYSR